MKRMSCYSTPNYTPSQYWTLMYANTLDPRTGKSTKRAAPRTFDPTPFIYRPYCTCNCNMVRFLCKNDTNPGKVWTSLYRKCLQRLQKGRHEGSKYLIARDGSKIKILTSVEINLEVSNCQTANGRKKSHRDTN